MIALIIVVFIVGYVAGSGRERRRVARTVRRWIK